jgi:hypothetical protein
LRRNNQGEKAGRRCEEERTKAFRRRGRRKTATQGSGYVIDLDARCTAGGRTHLKVPDDVFLHQRDGGFAVSDVVKVVRGVAA